MPMNNYMTFENASDIFDDLGAQIAALRGGYIFQESIPFASLPAAAAITRAMTGYTYNITDNFETDARFIEGAGKKYSAGTNVAVADRSTYNAVSPVGSEDPSNEGWYELVGGKYILSTDTDVMSGKTYYALTVDMKLDVISSFVDVDGIEADIAAIRGMISGAYDQTEAYAAGDILIHNGKLYVLKQAHAADADWDDATDNKWEDTDYTVETTVIELIEAAEPEPFTAAQVAAIKAKFA